MITIPYINDPIIKCNSENVYYPSDDTYLLIDYFKRNINETYFDDIYHSEIENILDLGTGTGIIAILFELLKLNYPNFKPKIFASDILKDALCCAEKSEAANNIDKKITFLNSNLFDSFPESLKHSFNIIVFNPPYLPALQIMNKNNKKKEIDYSWDGGLKGYDIIIKFLENSKEFLNLEKKHYIYMITSSRTNLLELDKLIRKLNFENKTVEKRHIFFEDIFLNRLSFKTY